MVSKVYQWLVGSALWLLDDDLVLLLKGLVLDELLLVAFLEEEQVHLLALFLVDHVVGVGPVGPLAIGDPRAGIRLRLYLEQALGLLFLLLHGLGVQCILDCFVHAELVVEGPFGLDGTWEPLLIQLRNYLLLVMVLRHQRRIDVNAANSHIARHVVSLGGEPRHLCLLSRRLRLLRTLAAILGARNVMQTGN